ncbi:MAG: hypothetical protein IPK93_10460 [Solirubrobacterales bacterium]|nr:hypothetical protein [Solirubrobacterales bacterium]
MIAPDGTTAVAWVSPERQVKVAIREAQGSFGMPQEIGRVGLFDDNYARVQVAMADDGTTCATWVERDGGYNVMASMRSPGQGFEMPAKLFGSTEEIGDPQVAVGGDGTCLVAWSGYPSSKVRVMTKRPRDRFRGPEVLGDGSVPIVAAGKDGTTSVMWSQGEAAPSARISVRPHGGDFSKSTEVSPGPVNLQNIEVSEDGVTEALIVKQVDLDNSILQVRTGDQRGRFSRPARVTSMTEGINFPEVSVGPDGTVNVAWEVGYTNHDGVYSATKLPGQRFGPSVLLAAGFPWFPQVATGRNGKAAAIWGIGGFGKFEPTNVEIAVTEPDSAYCSRAKFRIRRFRAVSGLKGGRFRVELKSPGDVLIRNSGRIVPVKRHRETADSFTVSFKPTRKLVKRLRRRGHAKIKLRVIYKPGFGCSRRLKKRTVRFVTS